MQHATTIMAESTLIGCVLFCVCFAASGVRVAVIGGGIGGASTAFHLRQLLPNASIDVFEREARVGGRIDHVDVDGAVETGASMWIRQNRLLHEFAVRAGLPVVRKAGSGLLGVWNGHDMVFRSSVFMPVTAIRALWRYGLASRDVQQLVDETVARFSRIYDIPAWSSVADLFGDELALQNLTQVTLETFLAARGISQTYIDELASAAVRVNYGQSQARISAFAGLVTLAAMSSDAFQLAGGNVQVVDAMLRRANASVRLQTPVHRIEKLSPLSAAPSPSTVWQRVVKLFDKAAPHEAAAPTARFLVNGEPFDYVVLATPVELASKLQFVGVRRPKERAFQTTHTLIVSGVPAATRELESVLTTESAEPGADFTSFALQKRFANGTAVFKVFSRRAVDERVLRSAFADGAFTVHWRKAWRAYTVLSPTAPSEWSDAVLDGEGALYTSALESCVSTMETAALAGRNAARWIAAKER